VALAKRQTVRRLLEMPGSAARLRCVFGDRAAWLISYAERRWLLFGQRSINPYCEIQDLLLGVLVKPKDNAKPIN
jgi:hypothetical protein